MWDSTALLAEQVTMQVVSGVCPALCPTARELYLQLLSEERLSDGGGKGKRLTYSSEGKSSCGLPGF